jgi:transposase-like protein
VKTEELWRGEVEASTPHSGTESKGVAGGGGRFPDPEVMKRPVRRSFSTGYKRRILEEASRCRKPGELGALLRREGLYSSTLSGWRRQMAAGVAWGLGPKRRGPKPANPLAGEVERLERDNQRLKHRLEKAELIIEFQKKACELLGIAPQEPVEGEEES